MHVRVQSEFLPRNPNGNGGAIPIPRPPFRLYRGPVLWGLYGALFATLAALAFVMNR